MIVSLKSCLHTKRHKGACHQSWEGEEGERRLFVHRGQRDESLCSVCATKELEGNKTSVQLHKNVFSVWIISL